MSNQLYREITCEFCGKTVQKTKKCRKLFGKDVCPDCVVDIVRVVNKLSVSGPDEGDSIESED